MAGLLEPWMAQSAGVVDYRTSPYFGGNPNAAVQESLGYGTGENFYSGLPDEVFDVLSYEAESGQPMRRINKDKLQQWLGSNQLMEANRPGLAARWMQDPSGQPTGPVDQVSTDDSKFMTGALLAAGLTGANILGAQGGIGSAMQGGGEAGLKSFAAMPPSAYDPTMLSSLASQGLGPVDMAFPELLKAGASGIGTLSGASSMPMPAAQQPPIPTGTTPPVTMPTVPPSVSLPGGGGGGLLDNVLKYAPLAGAIGGATPSGGDTITSQSKTDPRVDPFIYGDGGILKELQSWYSQNKAPNANQRAGWDKQLGLLADPALGQQLGTMRSNAFGLMGQPVAGNPFSSGQASLQAQPWQPMPRRGLFGG